MNEGLDRSLAELAETILDKRTREHVAEMSEGTLAKLWPAARMAVGYRANVDSGEAQERQDEIDSGFEQALSDAKLCKKCEKKVWEA